MATVYLIAAAIWVALVVLPVAVVWLAYGLDDLGFWAAFTIWFFIAGGLTALTYVLHQREIRSQ